MHALRLPSPSYLAALPALAGGLLLAWLPLEYGLVALAGAGLVALSLREPALALGVALLLGPTRAYLAATGRAGLLWDFGQIFFGLALAGWLARSLLRRELSAPRFFIFVPLGVWIFIGALSLYNAADWRDGLNELIKWIEVVLVIVIVYSEAQRGRLPWLIGALLLAGAAQAALGIYQYRFRGEGPESFLLSGSLYRAYGTFEQPNPFGGYLGLVWPLAAGLALGFISQSLARLNLQSPISSLRSLFSTPQPPRHFLLSTFFFLLTLLLLAGLYVSFSRGAWLGAAAAALAMAAFWPQRLSIGLGLVSAALVSGGLLLQAGVVPAGIAARLANVADFVNVSDVRGVNINDANFALVERLAHWQAAQSMIAAHPWLGVGLGNYAGAYPEYALANWPFHLGHAHNIYLHTWAETGLVGLVAYAAIWATVIILTLFALRHSSGLRRGLLLGLLGVWIHLLTHQIVDNLHVNNTDLLLATQIGVLHVIFSTRGQTGD